MDEQHDFALPEDNAYFTRWECTCDHEASEHTWNGCGADDCDCTASWEE